MSADPDLIRQVREEANAIVAEARDQAKRLMEAAEATRTGSFFQTDEEKRAGLELASNLEYSIEQLTQILEELKKQLHT